MAGMVLIGAVMLLGIGGAVTFALLSTPAREDVENPAAFAVLPVPESSPSARAFLEYYASQVSWMDAQVLQCVILIGTQESYPLCEEFAREYACFAAMTLAEAQAYLAQQCGAAPPRT